MKQPVTMVPGADISNLLAPVGGRRQELPGFDADYVDIVDYIVRCTHRIWEGRNTGLINTHYTADCIVHTLAGPTQGAATVIANTLATLQAFPDRTLNADHVIWSDNEPLGFHTSHRITSHMTHLGPNEFGPSTGRRATITTIADCAIRENRIYEEWLVRDNWSLATQLGADPVRMATDQAAQDTPELPVVHWWSAERDRVLSGAGPRAETAIGNASGATRNLADKVLGAWQDRNLGALRDCYSPTVEYHGPAGRRLFGAGAVLGFANNLLAAIPDAVLSIDHLASLPFFDQGIDVAVRWSLAGTHTGPGLHGAPSGLPVYLLAVSHWRVIAGRIVEDVTIWDEIALLRQLRQKPRRSR
jgi:predicted ester cyclase